MTPLTQSQARALKQLLSLRHARTHIDTGTVRQNNPSMQVKQPKSGHPSTAGKVLRECVYVCVGSPVCSNKMGVTSLLVCGLFVMTSFLVTKTVRQISSFFLE